MTVAEIKGWLKENADAAEVKAFLAEFDKPITAEGTGKWLETDDGKRFIQPVLDKRVTEAIKTYREGHFDAEVKKLVDEKVALLNPKETPEQKRIRELEEKDAKREAESNRLKLDNQVLSVLQAEGLPSWYVDYLPGGTIEEKKTAIAKIKSEQSERETKIRNELLAGGSYKPGGGGTGGDKKIDPSKLSQEDAVKLELEGKLDAIIQK